MISGLKGKQRILALLIGIIIIIATGCSALTGSPKEEGKKKDDKERPPSALTAMVEETDKIVTNIEKVRAEKAAMEREKENPSGKDKPGEEQQKKQQKEQQNSEGQQGGQEQKAKGQEQGQQMQGQQMQEQQMQEQMKQEQKMEEGKTPLVDWVSFDKSIEKLHAHWNDFEVSAKENKADESLVEEFEAQLNTLTEQIMARNEENTLIAANKLYGFYSAFLNLYKHMQPPEVKKVKYLVRQIIIDGQKDEWDETDAVLNDIKNAWEIAKARMEKPDKALNSKIDLAIDDFAAVAKQKKINLTKIKGDIIIKNLDQIK